MKPFTLYLMGKAGRMAAVVSLVAVPSFTLVSNAPIDPVSAYLGYDRMQITPAQEQKIIQRWGLDLPAHQRFFKWLGNTLQGDLGVSVIYNEPVAEVIQKRFSASIVLMGAAWLLSGILGFALGAIAGTFRNSWIDRAIRLYAYTLASTPTFWIAMVLLVIFSVSLGWFPFCCGGPLGVLPDEVTLLQRLHHLVLPVTALSVIGVAQIALHTREKMIDVFQSDFALYAASLGESRTGIAIFHGLRHTLLPALTLQFASFGELFGGAVLAEQVFSYPGLGRTTVEAGVRGDIPLLLGIVMFSTLFVVTGNIIADILYVTV
ncbi:MAG: ABC transporter permease, partial [Desulfobacterales bacterium]|nr:ABC transporter permease [Desulfobacterales bacterium]